MPGQEERVGEGEVIAVMKRKRDIMDYDPNQMITGAGLVFMMISSNGRIGLSTSYLQIICR